MTGYGMSPVKSHFIAGSNKAYSKAEIAEINSRPRVEYKPTPRKKEFHVEKSPEKGGFIKTFFNMIGSKLGFHRKT